MKNIEKKVVSVKKKENIVYKIMWGKNEDKKKS